MLYIQVHTMLWTDYHPHRKRQWKTLVSEINDVQANSDQHFIHADD